MVIFTSIRFFRFYETKIPATNIQVTLVAPTHALGHKTTITTTKNKKVQKHKKDTGHNNKSPELFLHPPAVTPFCQAPLYILMLHLEGEAILRKNRIKTGK